MRSHPCFPLFLRCEDHQHGLRVIFRNLAIGVGREETEQLAVLPAGLDLADASPGRMDAGEERQRPVLTEREPDLLQGAPDLVGLDKRREGNEAPVLRS